MGRCDILPKYGNGRIETVKELLNEKYNKLKNSEWQKNGLPSEYLRLEKRYEELYKERKEVEKQMKEIEHKEEFRINTWSGSKKIETTACNIPRNQAQALLKANKLMSLGMRKQANEIIEKIIEEEKLV